MAATESSTVMWESGRRGGQRCNGSIGECNVGDDEEGETTFDGGLIRRVLAGNGDQKYISYNVLKRDQTPCGHRGSSYYNCAQANNVNLYKRGCTQITKCQRNMG
ncbi:hypothetical protein Scep_011048 [Stephania cephalantha]|uniref:Rapid ALkalinization Factor n=1 Tax=Stephania cephalantha TaxID=152367 RepID=A0AAP0PET8_9MAGN